MSDRSLGFLPGSYNAGLRNSLGSFPYSDFRKSISVERATSLFGETGRQDFFLSYTPFALFSIMEVGEGFLESRNSRLTDIYGRRLHTTCRYWATEVCRDAATVSRHSSRQKLTQCSFALAVTATFTLLNASVWQGECIINCCISDCIINYYIINIFS